MKTKDKLSILKDMGAVSNEELIEKHYGKKGTPKREKFENEAQLQIIGEVLKQARKELNLTQEQVAKIMGITKTNISKIENNVKKQRIDTILRFVNALNAKMSIRIKLSESDRVFNMTF